MQAIPGAVMGALVIGGRALYRAIRQGAEDRRQAAGQRAAFERGVVGSCTSCGTVVHEVAAGAPGESVAFCPQCGHRLSP